MNKSQAAAEGQSTKQKEQATPAVHDEDDSGQNTSPTMLSKGKCDLLNKGNSANFSSKKS